MNARTLEPLIGPPRARYLVPALLLTAASVLLFASVFLPYWRMTLHAPQYPKGLTIRAYLDRLDGDVREIDGLNHYIGMRPLGEAAHLERSLSLMSVVCMSLLLLAAVTIHNPKAALLAMPAIVFPAAFLGDLFYWLHDFGHSLDPKAALSSAIKPFTPPVLGEGRIGQFRTVALPDTGLILAAVAAILVLAGLWFQRRAFKPLLDATVKRAVALVLLAVAAARADASSGFDLAAALRQAKPGDTIVVPAGVHAGPFVIDKPLTLIGRPGAVLSGGGHGDVVQIAAPHVTLRGFTIRATGRVLDQENSGVLVTASDAVIEDNVLEDVLFGIQLKGAHHGTIRRNVVGGKELDISWRGDPIRLWNSDDAVIEDNVVARGRDVVVWYSRNARLARNRVTGSRYGIHFMYCDGSRVENNVLEDNSVGAFLMYSRDMTVTGNRLAYNRGPSGYGLGLKDMDGLLADGNRIVGNRVGVFFDNSPSALDAKGVVRRNLIAYNDVGLSFQPAVKRNRVYRNAFLDNGEHVALTGGGEFTGNDFTVDGVGNYWSDYAGFDANGDGVGDLPYRSESLFENLMDRDPKLRLLQYSPAQRAIETAARAFPTIKPRPKLVDAAPLMDAPVPADLPSPAAPAWPMAALSGALLTVAGGAVAAARRPQAFAGIVSAAPAARIEPAASTLALENVTKRYGRFVALHRATVSVQPGEAVALWGENGAGKTTLIKCVLGLLRYEGRIVVAGVDLTREPREARRKIGYVPQELAFYDDSAVSDFLALVARLKRVDAARIGAVLEEVGLTAQTAKRIGDLSGGMKQRLALAAALLADPQVLLLDEITSSLDAAGRTSLLRLLREQQRAGKTILFSSHRLDEVEALAARVLRMEHGRVVADGPASDLRRALGAGSHATIAVPQETADRALKLLAEAGIPGERT